MDYEKNITIGNACDATLSVKIKKETVKEEYQKLLSKYVKEVALPGFRRGKVPAKIFEAKYADVLKKDLLTELVENCVKDIVEKLPKEDKPIGSSSIELKEEPQLNLDEDFTFTISYDISPKLTMTKTEGFSIKVPKVNVTDEHVQQELKVIQERNATFKQKNDDESLEKDNIVTIDFKVFDGEKEELNRKDYVYTLGKDANPYNFDDDIVGMKKGETKEIEKNYPEDYTFEHFRGKHKKISVTVKDIKVKILPTIDDELAQDVSSEFNTLDDLKKNIKERLLKDVELAIHREKENLLLEKLREVNPIIIPESMIMAEIREEVLRLFERIGASTDNVDQYVQENKEALLKDMKEDAIAKVHNIFLIEELKTTRTKANANDEEFNKYLEKLSSDMNMPLENLKKMCNDKHTKESIMNMLENDKLFDDIFKTCTFEDGDEIPSERYLNSNRN